MKWSRTLIPTLRDDPQEAEIPSHRLMLRAGLIKKLASGLYTWLPLGFRILRKVEGIVREEMDRAGGIEILMPILQPRMLWETSGRWEIMEEIMLRARSHSGRELILGPTHEEVVTDLVAHEINSYRQLPKNIYQINTKFRDEIRPRFGVMRSREFIMKDAYSFDVDDTAADGSYEAMYEAYRAIFARCGLSAMAVEADTGVMGGQRSHEFMVPAASGEDGIVCCAACGYAANAEQGELTRPEIAPGRTSEAIEEVATPEQRTVEELCAFFATTPDRFIKTLIYLSGEKPVAVLIRGDREVNEIKLAKVLGGAVELAGDEEIRAVTGAPVGFAGPVGLKGVRVIADYSLDTVVSGITGANRVDRHLKNVNIDRDCPIEEYYDLALVRGGDPCPRCGRPLDLRRGIEVGHVFKLGTKYSRAMGALYKDENGDDRPCVMGCFGIGVSRTVAAVVEQCRDEEGIVWPVSIAPYQVHIVLLGGGDERLERAAAEAHDLLEAGGVEVLLDDRDAAAGVKFNDADLIGIPLRITVGRKFLKTGLLEIKPRRSGEVSTCRPEELLERIGTLIAAGC